MDEGGVAMTQTDSPFASMYLRSAGYAYIRIVYQDGGQREDGEGGLANGEILYHAQKVQMVPELEIRGKSTSA